MNPTRFPAVLFFIRTAKNGSVAPPVPRFPSDLGLHPSGEPRPSLALRGALGDSGREKSGDEPALSAREHANPTIWSQIPLPLPSLLYRRRHHPSPIRLPVACTPPSLLPPAYIMPSGVPSAYIPSSGNSFHRASSTRPVGVRPFAWADMDSDNEHYKKCVD
jgi:hypothetical protein